MKNKTIYVGSNVHLVISSGGFDVNLISLWCQSDSFVSKAERTASLFRGLEPKLFQNLRKNTFFKKLRKNTFLPFGNNTIFYLKGKKFKNYYS